MPLANLMPGPAIVVAPLAKLESIAHSTGAGHLVTCLNVGAPTAAPASILPGRHLTLAMDDIEAARPGYVAPSAEHVGDLLAFVASWDRASPMLIHCHAGISRSTAAAFIAICALNPEMSEHLIAERLRAQSARAWPNRLLVSLADSALQRRGKMVRAIDSIGPGDIGGDNAPFALSAHLD